MSSNHDDNETANSLDIPAGMFRSGGEPKPITIQMSRLVHGPVNVDAKYTVIGDHGLFEGDIVLATREEIEAAEAAHEAKGIGISGDKYRWPKGVVPYRIVDESIRERVEAAIEHWQEKTPIRFVAKSTEHKDFVTFARLDGCWSRVGRQGGEQVVSLGPGCGLGAAIHEIGHVLGLWHEQSRSDRDDYVKIVWDNISEAHRHNFDKHVQDADDLGNYDHGSIMHYPKDAFSINGKDTIVTVDGQPIGQRNGLSTNDVTSIMMMYEKELG